MKADVLVIGGSTYDLTGFVAADTVWGDSNPGSVSGRAGGVGRNIAENSARMGLKTSLITATGTDLFSQEILNVCLGAGIDVSHSLILEDRRADCYMAILSKESELHLAVADYSLLESVDPGVFSGTSFAEFLNGFRALFVDTNCTEEMLANIFDAARVPVYSDTVSEAKAVRLLPYLDRLHSLKVNRAELAVLSGMPAENLQEIREASMSLIDRGVREVFVTMGKKGACCFTESEAFSVPEYPTEVRDVTGAGDSFAAAALYGALRGHSLRDRLLLGTAAAHITLQYPGSCCGDMCEEYLLQEFEITSGFLTPEPV